MPCIIDDKIIETPIRTILENLQQQVQALGIDKLRRIEYKASEARITCPIHKNGCENTPSCFVALTDKGDVVAGTTHCFTCGYKANIVRLVSDCLCTNCDSARKWLLGFCDYALVAQQREIPSIIKESSQQVNNYSTLPIITQEELHNYDYIHPYMFQRKLTADIIQKFEVGYDPKTDTLTFPVYVDGKCLFVAKRKVKSKQFFMPKIEPKPIYGLDYITSSEVVVCESVINALTCWVYGKQAVALFGLGSEYQIELLKTIAPRKIILAFDGDTYGYRASYKVANALKGIKIVSRLLIPFGKDINDLSKKEFDELKEIFV